MSKLFERLLEARGLDRSFLAPRYENLTDPFVLPDLDKAADRINQAIAENEKILIYGAPNYSRQKTGSYLGDYGRLWLEKSRHYR